MTECEKGVLSLQNYLNEYLHINGYYMAILNRKLMKVGIQEAQ